MDSKDDVEANRRAIRERIVEVVSNVPAPGGVDLIAFPELVTYIGPQESYPDVAEPVPGTTTEMVADLAQTHETAVLLGSLLERDTSEGNVYNTSVLIDSTGEIIGVYRKIHLFDIDTDSITFKESKYIGAGSDVVVSETDFGTVGMSICYDLRFPAHYSALRSAGAEIILIPAAFTLHTGKDHWYPLLRSRAIETQCYIVAPAQIGDKPTAAETYGRSLIVDPWGSIVSQASDRESWIHSRLDFEYLDKVRREMPVESHRKPEIYDK